MPILTAEDHDNFIRNGVLILRGLVPKDICETATAKLDEVAVKGVKPGDDIGSHPEVKALITDKVKQVLDEILGDELKKEDYGNPFSLMTPPQENLKEVSLAPDATGLHVDDDDPTVTPTGWCLRLVIFPRKVIPGGGGFIYSPGSHIRYMTQLMQSPNDAKSREIAQTLASPICEFTCEAGDTVIMSSILAHSGSKNWTNPLARHFVGITPGSQRSLVSNKALDELSTIEKVNSLQYYKERIGLNMPFPEIGDPELVDPVLANGWQPDGGISSFEMIRSSGINHCFVLSPDKPKKIRRFIAKDWYDFKEKEPIKLKRASDTIQIEQYGSTSRLCVSSREKKISDLYQTAFNRELCDWEYLGKVKAQAAATFRWSIWGSRSSNGFVLLYSDGTVLRRRLDPSVPGKQNSWAQLIKSRDNKIAWAGDGRQIMGMMIHSVRGESLFALVMDLQDGEKTSAHYILSGGDGCMYEDKEALPLVLADGSPVLQVSVYMRGKSYWLITYLKETADGNRLFWGTIDWDNPMVTPINNSQDLEAAFKQVGLR